jgi:hypothetical protein
MEYPQELNKDLQEILGRANFECGGIARTLRLGGFEIGHRADEEQAAVIHWTLKQYLQHGDNWKKEANKLLDSYRAIQKDPPDIPKEAPPEGKKKRKGDS